MEFCVHKTWWAQSLKRNLLCKPPRNNRKQPNKKEKPLHKYFVSFPLQVFSKLLLEQRNLVNSLIPEGNNPMLGLVVFPKENHWQPSLWPLKWSIFNATEASILPALEKLHSKLRSFKENKILLIWVWAWIIKLAASPSAFIQLVWDCLWHFKLKICNKVFIVIMFAVS